MSTHMIFPFSSTTPIRSPSPSNPIPTSAFRFSVSFLKISTHSGSVGAELPLRFARFQKKLGLNLPGIYSNVLSRGGGK